MFLPPFLLRLLSAPVMMVTDWFVKVIFSRYPSFDHIIRECMNAFTHIDGSLIVGVYTESTCNNLFVNLDYTALSSCNATSPDGASLYACQVGESSSSSAVCFSGSETVSLESGSVISISDVKVGDRVLAADLSGTLSFSEVISVPHSKNDIQTDFVELITKSGKSIKLTPGHMILAGACIGNDQELVRAAAVPVGACLSTVDGLEAVTATYLTKGSGLYTIVTMQEYVVVSGIVASPFAVSHTVGNSFYNIYRAIYSWFPFVLMSKAFIAAHQGVSEAVMALSA